MKEIAEGFVKSGVAELKLSNEELRMLGERHIFDTHQTQLMDKDNKVMDTMK